MLYLVRLGQVSIFLQVDLLRDAAFSANMVTPSNYNDTHLLNCRLLSRWQFFQCFGVGDVGGATFGWWVDCQIDIDSHHRAGARRSGLARRMFGAIVWFDVNQPFITRFPGGAAPAIPF